MKIIVYYEDKNRSTSIDVPDQDCEVWVEKDYQLRLEAASDNAAVTRRTAQEIMDEECNKPTFNNHQSETRRHVSLDALNADFNLIIGEQNVTAHFCETEYEELYRAIEKLRPQQRDTLRKLFWEGLDRKEIARAEGVSRHTIDVRVSRIYARLKKTLTRKNNFKKP
ncbi:MAG: sigma-70 family RNA polymerase sigma factor [Oscillospiraceae bacterium]|nr:sigma-70 family RNA polymerase sigma factor [Oscillospiraceae bacterium]